MLDFTERVEYRFAVTKERPNPSPRLPQPALEIKWFVFLEHQPEIPIFQIVFGPIDAKLPDEWADIHDQLLQASGQKADDKERKVDEWRHRFEMRCRDSELYAYATYLKWNAAQRMQCALSSFSDLVTWHLGDKKPDSVEALSLLRLEDCRKPNAILGLLLLRWAWAGSVVFEFLNVRADVGRYHNCQPAPSLVKAALDIATRIDRQVAWVETAPESDGRFWGTVLPSRLQEIRHAQVSTAIVKTEDVLKQRKLAVKKTETIFMPAN